MNKNKLSKTIILLIEDAIEETNSNDRIVLCEVLARNLESRYLGLNFEYQLKRMNIDSTKKILNAIDVYFSRYASQ